MGLNIVHNFYLKRLHGTVERNNREKECGVCTTVDFPLDLNGFVHHS